MGHSMTTISNDMAKMGRELTRLGHKVDEIGWLDDMAEHYRKKDEFPFAPSLPETPRKPLPFPAGKNAQRKDPNHGESDEGVISPDS